MSLLDIFIRKANIKDLTAEEQKTQEEWEKELAGKPVTIEGLKKFLQIQVKATDAEWSKWDNSTTKDLFLKVYIRFCRLMLAYLERPEKIKEHREKDIEGKIETEESKK